MNFRNRISMLARAALLAVVVVGVMATGLGVTTYALAKANELVLAYTQAEPLVKSHANGICLE